MAPLLSNPPCRFRRISRKHPLLSRQVSRRPLETLLLSSDSRPAARESVAAAIFEAALPERSLVTDSDTQLFWRGHRQNRAIAGYRLHHIRILGHLQHQCRKPINDWLWRTARNE